MEMGGWQPPSQVTVEVCVENAQGVRVARDAGADRVELTRELSTGGLTPSDELFTEALRLAPHQGLRVLVRENPDSFHLSAREAQLQTEAILRLRNLIGPASPQVGFVVGGLSGTRIDRVNAKRWREAAGAHYLVFHRAFDEVEDPEAALLELIDLGYDAVLTAGGTPGNANPSGLARLRELAQGRISIISAGGVREHNVLDVVNRSGTSEVHFRIPQPKAADGGQASVTAIVQLVKPSS